MLETNIFSMNASLRGDVEITVIPAVRIVRSRQVLGQHARSIFLEETDQRIRTGSAIEPQRERIFLRLVARLEEPVEDVDLDHVKSRRIEERTYVRQVKDQHSQSSCPHLEWSRRCQGSCTER